MCDPSRTSRLSRRTWFVRCNAPYAVSARRDFENLIVRIRQRLYPETIPILASYWLKTVCSSAHTRRWWKDLDTQLKRGVREDDLNPHAREALADLRAWISTSGVLKEDYPGKRSPIEPPFRTDLKPDSAAAYLARLLNEWLPTEVGRLLVEDIESAIPADAPPVLAVGRAIERLLVRERLSPESLEQLLRPDLLDPKYVYAADAEMLRDVVLWLLGSTAAPPFPIRPPLLIMVPEASPLPSDVEERLRVAAYGESEIQVAISASQAKKLLEDAPTRIASILVTADGRWWESDELRSGELHSLVYRPGGRLRIDRSAQHARLKVPWPESRLHWSGNVELVNGLELFGREWHASTWESDGERTWLHLEFAGVLPISQIQPDAEESLRRSRPAHVDMAWSALENALATAVADKDPEAIEQLRRAEFIPLGRAIYALAGILNRLWAPKRAEVLSQLRAIRYLESQLAAEYGLTPCKILPQSIQVNLLKRRPSPEVVDLLRQTFEGLPPELSEAPPSRAA